MWWIVSVSIGAIIIILYCSGMYVVHTAKCSIHLARWQQTQAINYDLQHVRLQCTNSRRLYSSKEPARSFHVWPGLHGITPSAGPLLAGGSRLPAVDAAVTSDLWFTSYPRLTEAAFNLQHFTGAH